MRKKDLHDEFVEELTRRIPRRVDLINFMADILKIEKESVYRRMSGKVNISIREMGILAEALNISLDSLVYKDEHVQWLPFVLETPMKSHSIDSLCEIMDFNFRQIGEVTRHAQGETGNVYNSIPLEFFIHSPLMTKFMFFKWGHYFVKSEEFNNFSTWEIPERLSAILPNYNEIYNFREAFYIWDSSIVWSLAKEIDNFHRMRIITTQEKDEIKHELSSLLLKLEQTLNGTHTPGIPLPSEMSFYVSSMNVGFTSGYFQSGSKHVFMFQTNFSFSMVENSPEAFARIKEWVKSLRSISTLLSQSGRIERRLFFDTQHKIIEDILK